MLNSLNNRILHLEEKFAYQEKTVDALNDVIIEQQAQINNLEEEVRRLRLQINSADEASPELPNVPPPHY